MFHYCRIFSLTEVLMSKVQEITDAEFEAEILKHPSLSLVDFWASWCGPCRMMSPIVDAISAEFTGRLKVAKLNVDDNAKTSAKYAVMSIPTLILFKEGEELERLVGFIAQKNLSEKISSYL